MIFNSIPGGKNKRDDAHKFELGSFVGFSILTMLALLGNYLSLPLSFGVNVLFGGIFVLVILHYYGLLPALIACAISSSYTIVLWGHPYAAVIFMMEILVAGYLYCYREKHDLVRVIFLFWIFIGLPSVFFLYKTVLELSTQTVIFIWFKSTINGVTNALTASIIILMIPDHVRKIIRPSRLAANDTKVSMDRYLSLLLLSVIIFPSLAGVTYLHRLASSRLPDQVMEYAKDEIRRGATVSAFYFDEKLKEFNLLGDDSTRVESFAIAEPDLFLAKVMADGTIKPVSLDRQKDSPILPTKDLAAKWVKEKRVKISMREEESDQIIDFFVPGSKQNGTLMSVSADMINSIFKDMNHDGMTYYLTRSPAKEFETRKSNHTIERLNEQHDPDITIALILSANSELTELKRWETASVAVYKKLRSADNIYIGLQVPYYPFITAYREQSGEIFLTMTIPTFLVLMLLPLLIKPIKIPVTELIEFATENQDTTKQIDWRKVNKLRSPVIEINQLNDSIVHMLRSTVSERLEQTRIAADLTALINTANAPIFGIDADGLVNEWNQSAERITGFTRDEVMGRDLVANFITKDYKTAVKEVLEKALAGEETANYEFLLYTKRGDRVKVLLNATPRKDPEGDVVGVVGVGQDITELSGYREKLEFLVQSKTKELEKSLKEKEYAKDQIDTILKSVADGLIVTNNENKIVLMNPSAEKLLNIRFREAVNRPINDAIGKSELHRNIKATLKKSRQEKSFDFEIINQNSGDTRIMRARTAAILDQDGSYSGNVTIFNDVTRERKIDRMKTEFLSTAAHELRTPLTSIGGFSELMLTRQDLTDEERVKFLGFINNQSIKLTKIINDLLDVSRIESGKGFTLNKTACNVGDGLLGLDDYFNGIKKNGQILNITVPESKVELFVDKPKMEQVLINLISNAVKYSHEGSRINISGKVVDKKYEIKISDDGFGMTQEDLDKVFEKFFRADSSDTAVEGTGLGLTIVRHIVHAHNGTIHMDSTKGKGTTITILLPIET